MQRIKGPFFMSCGWTRKLSGLLAQSHLLPQLIFPRFREGPGMEHWKQLPAHKSSPPTTCTWAGSTNTKRSRITRIVFNILFGVCNENEDFAILNHLILIAKYFNYKRKLNKSKPTLKVFFEKIKLLCHIEVKIAKRNDRLHKQYKKMGKMMPLLN